MTGPEFAAAPQPATDDEARMRVFQIIGSDIDAPAAFTGDWHQALKDTAARWATQPAPDDDGHHLAA